MRVYEAIVQALGEIGVDAAFGGAGENAAGLMLALSESDRVRGIIAKNEQAAAFMACGYAMFTDRLGVCFATAGPGAFNLVSGLAVALTDSYPVLAITGYSTVAWEGRGGLNETSGLNRTPNSHMIFDAVCKKIPGTDRPANWLVTDPGAVMSTLEQAVRVAFEGRPGPGPRRHRRGHHRARRRGAELPRDRGRPRAGRARPGAGRRGGGHPRRGAGERPAGLRPVRVRRDPRRAPATRSAASSSGSRCRS